MQGAPAVCPSHPAPPMETGQAPEGARRIGGDPSGIVTKEGYILLTKRLMRLQMPPRQGLRAQHGTVGGPREATTTPAGRAG